MEADFQQNVTAFNNFNVVKNEVTFFTNTVLDLSAFSLQATELNFYESRFNAYSVYTNLQHDPYYGLYGFSVS